MIHRVMQIGGNDAAFVTRGKAYTAFELWLAGLAGYGGNGWAR